MSRHIKIDDDVKGCSETYLANDDAELVYELIQKLRTKYLAQNNSPPETQIEWERKAKKVDLKISVESQMELNKIKKSCGIKEDPIEEDKVVGVLLG